MRILSTIKMFGFYLNYLRTIPVYLSYKTSAQRGKIKMDLDRWRDVTSDRCEPEKSDLKLMNRLLFSQIPFRNLIQMRLKTPPHTLKSALHYLIAKILWRKDSTLSIATYNIGGGLFIQHGFATMVAAKSIGKTAGSISKLLLATEKGRSHL